MRKRTRARDYAVSLMYSSEISESGMEETMENFRLEYPDEDSAIRDFAEKLFRGSFASKERDEETIKGFIAKNWSFERIAEIEKSIIRTAIWELFEGDAPVYAIMDDYVSLAKKYGDDKSAAFINGILENIRIKFAIERGNGKNKPANKN